jgi:hypothetical protein
LILLSAIKAYYAENLSAMPAESDAGFLSTSDKTVLATTDVTEAKRRTYTAGLYNAIRNCLPPQDKEAIFIKIEPIFRKNFSSMHSAVISSDNSIINVGREQALESFGVSITALKLVIDRLKSYRQYDIQHMHFCRGKRDAGELSQVLARDAVKAFQTGLTSVNRPNFRISLLD